MRFSFLTGFVLSLTLMAPVLAEPSTLETAPAALIQTCAAHWKTAKNRHSTRPGDTWPSFLARCQTLQGRMTESSPEPQIRTLPVRPAEARKLETTPKMTGSRKNSPAQRQVHQRMRQCGNNWKQAKAAGTLPPGQTWPRYWSACNARLKTSTR